MKRLTAKEVRELRKKERILIDDRMQELADDDIVRSLSMKKTKANTIKDGEQIDVKDVAKIVAELHKDVVSRFRGVTVIVDRRLIGNNYYIAVSPDLYDQIEQNNEEEREVDTGGDGDRQRG